MKETFYSLSNEEVIKFHSIPNSESEPVNFGVGLILVLFLLFIMIFLGTESYAQGARLPGEDASAKLEAAGTLLRLIDTALFKWGARILAGLSLMSGAWALKEQRFGVAVICMIGAMLFGTAPAWVKNLFSISSSDSVFGVVFFTPLLYRSLSFLKSLKSKLFKNEKTVGERCTIIER